MVISDVSSLDKGLYVHELFVRNVGVLQKLEKRLASEINVIACVLNFSFNGLGVHVHQYRGDGGQFS